MTWPSVFLMGMDLWWLVGGLAAALLGWVLARGRFRRKDPERDILAVNFARHKGDELERR